MPVCTLNSNHGCLGDLKFFLLADNFFRTCGKDDYFGCEEYRMMALLANPDQSFATADVVVEKPHNGITHITAPALAFLEIKVRICVVSMPVLCICK